MTVLTPEAHTLLTRVQGDPYGSPAPREACLAGFWPIPPDITFPMMTSSTLDGSRLIWDSAALMAKDPSSEPLILESPPRKVPIGVLLPATM